jgi:hypothetical protein
VAPKYACGTAPASSYPELAANDPGHTLMLRYGCDAPAIYWFSDGSGKIGSGHEEYFTICPKSASLDDYVAWLASGHSGTFVHHVHENPNVCNTCLYPAPPGKIYVLWTGDDPVPTCQGGCASEGWW